MVGESDREPYIRCPSPSLLGAEEPSPPSGLLARAGFLPTSGPECVCVYVWTVIQKQQERKKKERKEKVLYSKHFCGRSGAPNPGVSNHCS